MLRTPNYELKNYYVVKSVYYLMFKKERLLDAPFLFDVKVKLGTPKHHI